MDIECYFCVLFLVMMNISCDCARSAKFYLGTRKVTVRLKGEILKFSEFDAVYNKEI
jgi:hypothetical protein